MFLAGMDEVATHNSSAAGGSLPAHMHFARLNYARETILPTRWWLWRYAELLADVRISERS